MPTNKIFLKNKIIYLIYIFLETMILNYVKSIFKNHYFQLNKYIILCMDIYVGIFVGSSAATLFNYYKKMVIRVKLQNIKNGVLNCN